MSIFAAQAGYFSSVENNENNDAAKVRVKGGESQETRLPVSGKRTVLGALTNIPLSNVPLKPKQVTTTVSFIFAITIIFSVSVLELLF